MSYLRSVMELESGVCVERYLPAVTKSRNPLLFVHGNFHGSWMWRFFLEYFSSRGVSCYALNFRGHWLSRGHAELGRAVTEDYVQDVRECLAAINGEVILIGHSMGGVVCQKAAEGAPLKKLILLDSAPCRAVTEGFLKLDPERKGVAETMFIPQPDNTRLWAKDRDKTCMLLFEKNKVSAEVLAQTVDCLGRESALVLQNHALLEVDPGKLACPVYVLGRTGLGNKKNPNLWDALADYYHAADRSIRGDISHNMMLEDDWQEHAARIAHWCRSY
jgi:pimeloyl-ACP methyl ester carboxylesterase